MQDVPCSRITLRVFKQLLTTLLFIALVLVLVNEQGVMSGVPAAAGYQGGFSSALMLKDLRLALELAGSCAQPTPMGQAASELYAQVWEWEQEAIWGLGAFPACLGEWQMA